MTSQDRGPQIALASEINVLLGVWLIISPFFYTISAPATASATWNNVIVGTLIVICAALRTFSHQRRVALSGVNIVLGIWTLISPWIYGYSTDAPRFGTNIVAGSLVIALAILSGCRTYREHRHQATRQHVDADRRCLGE